MVSGQRGQFQAEALHQDVKPFGVGLGDLDNEVVRHQRATLCDDRSSLVHLMLDRARHLDRLHFGLEDPGKGPLNHALKPSFEALKNAHPSSLPSACYASDVICGTSTFAAVLT